jgi:formylglycine-generating enzyme required for sulfatase activity/energy-coupling factor transporter ATP-binding protein EcfA2
MSDGDSSKTNIQASDNSVAVGNVNVGGSIGGDFFIGNKGFSADEVSVLITQISTTFQAKPFDGRSPYKGLETFNEEDAELFFGRERWVENLMGRVKESRTLFVTGQSGSGKSSLARAGLIPALKKTDYGASWLYATMKPGRDPIDALATAFSRLKDPGLGKYLRENAGQASVLHECAESALSENANQRLVLYIDQFEEVFTQLSKDKAQVFINLLDHAATVENGRMIILFSMRSDFVPNCATYPQLNAILNQQFVQIGAMQPEELVGAIAQPALRVGLKIDPDLIAQIINDMKGEPGALPLMQFALKDLFDAEQAKGGMIALTLNDYLARGGINQALERHANASLEKLTDEEKELARNVFSGLIEIGRGTQDTRRTALSNELIPAGAQAEAVKMVVQKLASARLITTDATTVTISHEKLIDAWSWLKKLVNENRDVIALQNQITADAQEWKEHQRDSSYLYSGARLANAKDKMAAQKLALSGLAQRFISIASDVENAKAREEERRRQKELDDARKLAESARAQAQAERRGRLVARGFLIVAFILIVVLSYDPIRREILRQHAMKSEMVNISAGDYFLGDQEQWTKDNPDLFLPYQKYAISTFSIDVYPVTNMQYGLCIRAGICSRPNSLQSIYEDEVNANKPVINITALDAAEFCDWIGQALPNDKEWELAVRKEKIKSINGIWEWTRSPYDQSAPEWTDVTSDPPEALTQKGGTENLTENMTFRQSATSTQSDKTTGFRCASTNSK